MNKYIQNRAIYLENPAIVTVNMPLYEKKNYKKSANKNDVSTFHYVERIAIACECNYSISV